MCFIGSFAEVLLVIFQLLVFFSLPADHHKILMWNEIVDVFGSLNIVSDVDTSFSDCSYLSSKASRIFLDISSGSVVFNRVWCAWQQLTSDNAGKIEQTKQQAVGDDRLRLSLSNTTFFRAHTWNVRISSSSEVDDWSGSYSDDSSVVSSDIFMKLSKKLK